MLREPHTYASFFPRAQIELMYTPAGSPVLDTCQVGAPPVPSANVTVPVGAPAPGATGVTVAVNVTGCPAAAGFAFDVTAVVVAALLTTCVRLPELPVKFPAPP